MPRMVALNIYAREEKRTPCIALCRIKGAVLSTCDWEMWLYRRSSLPTVVSSVESPLNNFFRASVFLGKRRLAGLRVCKKDAYEGFAVSSLC